MNPSVFVPSPHSRGGDFAVIDPLHHRLPFAPCSSALEVWSGCPVPPLGAGSDGIPILGVIAMPSLTRPLPASRFASHLAARVWGQVLDPRIRVASVLRTHVSLRGKLRRAIRLSRRAHSPLILPGFTVITWEGAQETLVTLADGSCCCRFAECLKRLEQGLDEWLTAHRTGTQC